MTNVWIPSQFHILTAPQCLCLSLRLLLLFNFRLNHSHPNNKYVILYHINSEIILLWASVFSSFNSKFIYISHTHITYVYILIYHNNNHLQYIIILFIHIYYYSYYYHYYAAFKRIINLLHRLHITHTFGSLRLASSMPAYMMNVQAGLIMISDLNPPKHNFSFFLFAVGYSVSP